MTLPRVIIEVFFPLNDNMTNHQNNSHTVPRRLLTWVYSLSLWIGLAHCALVLVSWIITAAMPDLPLRSLLSAGGVRWFMGNFATNLASPILVYLILCAIAWGSIASSGLLDAMRSAMGLKASPLNSQQRFAIRGSFLLLIIEVVAIILLAFTPHAILLGVTGDLFPSSFSESLVPILAFIVASVSGTYSVLSRRVHSVYDLGQSLCSAGTWLLPLLLLYVMAATFYHSLVYVLGSFTV